VFDRPQVVGAARQAIEAKNYQARCEAVAGDFFKPLPIRGRSAQRPRHKVGWS
jgi:hypothetical protein